MKMPGGQFSRTCNPPVGGAKDGTTFSLGSPSVLVRHNVCFQVAVVITTVFEDKYHDMMLSNPYDK